MPPKYRQMADFHEYYSGTRTAPYLTVFIGGNHEASNHLFELYYGGWVAPNIYYLGAANVLRFGPLRIAGLTGIWKGYDYRKPHFERLPYNQEEMTSIFHVRELDVRKLLSLRSQVDIGLSHDWPQGVENYGDYNWLFQTKPDFGTDSRAGKLGSVAARQCLERLRPPYWFSAHLHTKFAAIFPHDQDHAEFEAATRSHQVAGRKGGRAQRTERSEAGESSRATIKSEDRPQVSAWQQFHVGAQQADAAERDRILQEREDRQIEDERTGVQSGPGYSLEETFHKIDHGEDLGRTLVSTTRSQVDTAGHEVLPQLDGCFQSRPSKRQRVEDDEQAFTNGLDHDAARESASRDQTDGATASIANPDAIEIDMSDDEDTTAVASTATPQIKPFSATDTTPRISQSNSANATDFSKSLSEESDGGVKLNPQATTFAPKPSISSLRAEAETFAPTASRKSSDSSLNPIAQDFQPQSPPTVPVEEPETNGNATAEPESLEAKEGNEVSDEMRAQLAALSSNFTAPKPTEVSPPLPFPEEITNKTTNFLALGKCERYQEFLQLLEIDSMTSNVEQIQRPVRLSYDPEWLAIQRVFAPELQLGGVSTDKVSPDHGETYYRERIEKETEWITEHVVKPGKLEVPENFTVTAPIYDPRLQVESDAMPREVTNPQTSAFCELIGIENKFDISEEERDFRMQQGPRPERDVSSVAALAAEVKEVMAVVIAMADDIMEEVDVDGEEGGVGVDVVVDGHRPASPTLNLCPGSTSFRATDNTLSQG
ncbi:lariat debranching enzyme [Cladophialophora chaetospira]|uniref:Lariat debranching enzyme n=1 Tax=Cladophialophora chaetospira TaxID=386627 RepID=A0AA39CL45_9EURO|nr:lariat debranching enzyme [Cladophialophora chaetospira]